MQYPRVPGVPVVLEHPLLRHTQPGGCRVWKGGEMALRWVAAGMIEAGRQFRRVNGHLHLPALRAALERETAQTVAPAVHDGDSNAA
jgi:putative transposase